MKENSELNNICDIRKKAIIVGASADIGVALCDNWGNSGWEIYGTYRTMSADVERIKSKISLMVNCDLGKKNSVDKACERLKQHAQDWDVLVLCPGLQDPIQLFHDCDFDEWAKSIEVNFINQLRFVHNLLSSRRRVDGEPPTVLFFAGGGTNNATVRYSAYTASKIALIKMVELLAAEITDVKFIIIGPGWVKTKIHNSTLLARDKAGDNYQRTVDKLKSNECTPMDKVVECCNILISGPSSLLTGRNFSVVFDKWGTDELNSLLLKYPDMYKLRRYGNEL